MITKNYSIFAKSKQNKYFRSPLFYVGDKYKLIQEITPYFPKNIKKFIEPFVGGGSVFMNVKAETYILNDIDFYIIALHKFLCDQANSIDTFFRQVDNKISNYGLSCSYKQDIVPDEFKQKYKKTYYAHFNKNAFQELKNDFNSTDKTDMLHLYLLLIYGFNRMLRFNSAQNYNLPVGNVDFNKNVVNALYDYFNIVKQKKIYWVNSDYKRFTNDIQINKEDFIYFDPPYLITYSEYNKHWNEDKEIELLNLLSDLDAKGIKFAISNLISYKGRINTIFNEWAKKFTIIPIKSNYISYHDNSIKQIQEVLVINYDKEKFHQ